MWAAVHPAFNPAHVKADASLNALYEDAASQLPNCDFIWQAGRQPEITLREVPPAPAAAPAPPPYIVWWDKAVNLDWDPDFFSGTVIHELAHAAARTMYQRQGVDQGEMIWANIHLPAAEGAPDQKDGLADNQRSSLERQRQTLNANWSNLSEEAIADRDSGALPDEDYKHVEVRIGYAIFMWPVGHNETVLGDLMYYLRAKKREGSLTYAFARRMLDEANARRKGGLGAEVGEVRRPGPGS